jgi:hypothetical protein
LKQAPLTNRTETGFLSKILIFVRLGPESIRGKIKNSQRGPEKNQALPTIWWKRGKNAIVGAWKRQ